MRGTQEKDINMIMIPIYKLQMLAGIGLTFKDMRVGTNNYVAKSKFSWLQVYEITFNVLSHNERLPLHCFQWR